MLYRGGAAVSRQHLQKNGKLFWRQLFSSPLARLRIRSRTEEEPGRTDSIAPRSAVRSGLATVLLITAIRFGPTWAVVTRFGYRIAPFPRGGGVAALGVAISRFPFSHTKGIAMETSVTPVASLPDAGLPDPKAAMLPERPNGNLPSLATLGEQTAHDLVQLFKLLADETRLRIIHYLTQKEELNVRTFCQLLGQSQPAVSHHLALMRAAGVLECRRDGKHNFYRLLPERCQGYLDVMFGVTVGTAKIA